MIKNLTTLLLTLLVLGGCTKEIPLEKLQIRNEIAYEVNSQTPFTGTVIDYFQNGQIMLSVNYVNGKKDGRSVIYYRNGAFSEIQEWKDGKKDGTWEKYYRDNETLSLTSVWKDGEKEYQIRHFNKDGVIESPNEFNIYEETIPESPEER